MNASITNSAFYRQTSAGFTLIELMITIAIIAIIVSIAAPSISTQLANQRVKSTTATLANALKEAKAESIIRRQKVVVSVDDSSTKKAITLSANIAHYNYNAKSSISAVDEAANTATAIDFQPSKTADKRTYTICDSNTNAISRQVVVTKVAIITNQTGGTCG